MQSMGVGAGAGYNSRTVLRAEVGQGSFASTTALPSTFPLQKASLTVDRRSLYLCYTMMLGPVLPATHHNADGHGTNLLLLGDLSGALAAGGWHNVVLQQLWTHCTHSSGNSNSSRGVGFRLSRPICPVMVHSVCLWLLQALLKTGVGCGDGPVNSTEPPSQVQQAVWQQCSHSQCCPPKAAATQTHSSQTKPGPQLQQQCVLTSISACLFSGLSRSAAASPVFFCTSLSAKASLVGAKMVDPSGMLSPEACSHTHT